MLLTIEVTCIPPDPEVVALTDPIVPPYSVLVCLFLIFHEMPCLLFLHLFEAMYNINEVQNNFLLLSNPASQLPQR